MMTRLKIAVLRFATFALNQVTRLVVYVRKWDVAPSDTTPIS